jgi:hypothetical protein
MSTNSNSLGVSSISENEIQALVDLYVPALIHELRSEARLLEPAGRTRNFSPTNLLQKIY